MEGTLADNIPEYETGAYNEQIFKNYFLQPNNIIFMEAESSYTGLHPTQKPLKLMKLLIELTTAQDHVVFDPFCGSGTTLVAASILGRNYIGIEQDEKFYNVAVNRMDAVLKEKEALLFSNI